MDEGEAAARGDRGSRGRRGIGSSADDRAGRWRSLGAGSSPRASRSFAPTTKRFSAAGPHSRPCAFTAGGRFGFDAHLERLGSSAEAIGLPPVEPATFEELAALVLAERSGADAVLRLVWTAGSAEGDPAGFALLSEVPGWIEDVRSRGARAVSLLGVRAAVPWLLPGVKSTSYAVNMAAEAEAKRRDADEAVFVDGHDVVLEGTVTNVWWRSGRVLVTPALDLGILAGVTRATLLELAGSLGYSVEQGAYPLEALYGADEAFTSSSVREVMPLVEIDGRPLGRGPASDELQEALRAAASELGTGAPPVPSSAWRRTRCGSAAWRSRTECSSTARPRGELPCATRTARCTSPPARSRASPTRSRTPVLRGPLRLAGGVRAPSARPSRASAGALRRSSVPPCSGRSSPRRSSLAGSGGRGARPAGGSSSPALSRSLRPRSLSAGPASPSTTAPSTSPSARTRTVASGRRRSIRAAARS